MGNVLSTKTADGTSQLSIPKAVAASVVGAALTFVALKLVSKINSKDETSDKKSIKSGDASESGEGKLKKLVRIDSELDIPETPLNMTNNPFDVDVSGTDEDIDTWETFALADAGITLMYPPKLKPQQQQNVILFGEAKALNMLILEKSHTREELRRLIQFSGQMFQKSTDIVSEKAFKIQSNHEAYEFEVSTGGQKSWTCAIIDHTRTILISYDVGPNQSSLSLVKKLASTLSISEPKTIGSLFVKAKKNSIMLPLPSIHYMLQFGDEDEDESTILHARDIRKKNSITSGIRIKKRVAKKDKTITLDELVAKRVEELKEFSPKQQSLPFTVAGTNAVMLHYRKPIKQHEYEMIDVLFVEKSVGYIAQIYALVEIAAEGFSSQALECISKLQFYDPISGDQQSDVFVYEQPSRQLSVEVPAKIQCIKEYPLSEEMLVDFIHETNDPEVEYITLVLKKKVNRKLISDLEILKEQIRTDIAQQNKVFREHLQNPQMASMFGDLITLLVCEIDKNPARPAVVVLAKSYNPMNMEPQKTFSTYVLTGEDMYTLQTTITDIADSQAIQEEIEAMHKSFTINQ